MNDISSIGGFTKLIPDIVIIDNSILEIAERLSDKLSLQTQYSFGNGANQVNKAYVEQAVFDQASVQTHVLTDGSLKNVFGGNFDPNAMKYLVISHNAASLASDITITGTFIATVYASLAALPPGTSIVLERPADGWPIGGGETIITTNNDAGQDATVDFLYLASL